MNIKDTITSENSKKKDIGYCEYQDIESVEFTFTPRWVEIENDKLHANIAWKSTGISGKRSRSAAWRYLSEGTPLKVSGS
jgi:hypothetical protein